MILVLILAGCVTTPSKNEQLDLKYTELIQKTDHVTSLTNRLKEIEERLHDLQLQEIILREKEATLSKAVP